MLCRLWRPLAQPTSSSSPLLTVSSGAASALQGGFVRVIVEPENRDECAPACCTWLLLRVLLGLTACNQAQPRFRFNAALPLTMFYK